MSRIALVEDNPDNRLLVRALLAGRHDVDEYETGAAALEGLARDRPDLVLMDISLPEMDGTEVLQRIRDEPALADLPVIALTAHAMATDRERFLEMGFDEYVSKPITDDEELFAKIDRLLAR